MWASTNNWSLVSACSILVVVILQYAGGRESCRLVGSNCDLGLYGLPAQIEQCAGGQECWLLVGRYSDQGLYGLPTQ